MRRGVATVAVLCGVVGVSSVSQAKPPDRQIEQDRE